MAGNRKEKNGPGVQKIIKETLVYALLLIWALINVFPIYWMFTFSLKSNEEIYGKNIVGLPWVWRWENYGKALKVGNIGLYFANSVFVSAVTIVLVMLVSLMATFALTRFIWRGKKMMNDFFMLGLTIPIHVSVVPVMVTLKNLHLLNTYSSLIIPYTAFSMAMAILICTGFMQEIPFELDEAACIDGCGTWKIFFTIIVPLMKPAVATVSIYTLLQCWNEFMFASNFITGTRPGSWSHSTLPVGIQNLFGQYMVDWGPVGAAMVLATFPMLLFYVCFSKKIQDSFIAGAVKG